MNSPNDQMSGKGYNRSELESNGELKCFSNGDQYDQIIYKLTAVLA